jgi:hypothetical protein
MTNNAGHLNAIVVELPRLPRFAFFILIERTLHAVTLYRWGRQNAGKHVD